MQFSISFTGCTWLLDGYSLKVSTKSKPNPKELNRFLHASTDAEIAAKSPLTVKCEKEEEEAEEEEKVEENGRRDRGDDERDLGLAVEFEVGLAVEVMGGTFNESERDIISSPSELFFSLVVFPSMQGRTIISSFSLSLILA